ncbi:hypothetical protein [Nibricoccus sp. IMCC34717]|uniref:hypothetical protein n=1 Tax=Nibricoccus sp. IMCC34717 TaxID=3034021 RepID=UPI00384C2546
MSQLTFFLRRDFLEEQGLLDWLVSTKGPPEEIEYCAACRLREPNGALRWIIFSKDWLYFGGNDGLFEDLHLRATATVGEQPGEHSRFTAAPTARFYGYYRWPEHFILIEPPKRSGRAISLKDVLQKIGPLPIAKTRIDPRVHGCYAECEPPPAF